MGMGGSLVKPTVVRIYSPALTWNTTWLSASHLQPVHYNHNWGITIMPDYSFFGSSPDSLPPFLFPSHAQKSFGLLPCNSRWLTHHFKLGGYTSNPEVLMRLQGEEQSTPVHRVDASGRNSMTLQWQDTRGRRNTISIQMNCSNPLSAFIIWS